MKILVMALALAISATAQQKSATKSTAKKAQQPKQKATAPIPSTPISNAPPKDAKKIDDTHWRWVDPKTGKAWVYYFGGVSWIRKPEEQVQLNKPASRALSAVDRGETVEFTRNMPMGPTRWTKKKSELNADEQAALDAAQQEKK